MKLKDKGEAIVFGHSSGLGRELADLLMASGYKVVGVARTKVVAENITNIVADLSTESGVNIALDAIKKDFPRFDVLIYAAGVLGAHDINNLSYETIEHLFRVNVFAPMTLESGLFDLICENEADVVNVTSSSIVDYYPKFSEYSSSKAAFAKFTDDLRRSLSDSPARVIDICPSGFTSNLYSTMLGDKVERDESKQIQTADLAKFVMDILKLPRRIEVGKVFVNRKS